jgi:glycosyltransferase involved in cell wall biosynthesis
MRSKSPPLESIRLHLTNVTGAGATQLLSSLLPALIRNRGAVISQVYLPATGQLSEFTTSISSARLTKYRRVLPNLISRLLECTFFANSFNGRTPLLVFGDLPLRIKAPQILFVQTYHVVKDKSPSLNIGGWKYSISRFIFRLNLKRVNAIIVQTEVMRKALEATYPSIRDRIHVVPQPVPQWLHGSRLGQPLFPPIEGRGLRLIYPAAYYPHKNHNLLSHIQKSQSSNWSIDDLSLTINPSRNPAPLVPWIRCVDFLSSSDLISAYGKVDALLFLSSKESFGFPLLEAMYLGLPVVCPDLPYANWMCGDQGIYFDPKSVQSLKIAIERLRNLLISGWRPDWSDCLKKFPENWDVVASRMIDISLHSRNSIDSRLMD